MSTLSLIDEMQNVSGGEQKLHIGGSPWGDPWGRMASLDLQLGR